MEQEPLRVYILTLKSRIAQLPDQCTWDDVGSMTLFLAKCEAEAIYKQKYENLQLKGVLKHLCCIQ